MSKLEIEETFEVAAPVDRVWAFLLDPANIAGCLPGATLDEITGERTFTGRIKVKVGPVTMAFKGKAEMIEVDEALKHIVIHGEGRGQTGADTVKMTMKSHLVETDTGGTKVVVSSDVHMAGKMVRFGRGMMQGVSAQLFKEFVAKAKGKLEPVDSGWDAPDVEAEPVGEPTEPAPAEDRVEPPPRVEEAVQEAEAVNAVTIVLRVMWDAIVAFVRRVLALLGLAEPATARP